MQAYKNHYPVIDATAYIDESARVIGQVTIDSDSSIWPMTVIRGDVNTIQIGSQTSIQDGSVIHVTHDSSFTPGGRACMVGNEVTVGHKVMLHGCTIQDRCMIGMGAIILDGVVVESDVFVGAGSVVPPNKVLVTGYLYYGAPVKQIRPLTHTEIKHIQYNAQHYVRLKNDYL